MIEFDEAIRIAQENAEKLVKGAKNLVLEGVLISADDKLYEITISYDLDGPDSLKIQNESNGEMQNIIALASIMRKRREYKVFLVDKRDGQFRGFKNYKEN